MEVVTKDFATRTIFQEQRNKTPKDYWCMAIDIGYSAAKGISPNSMYCFPSFARKTKSQTIDMVEASDSDIIYRDDAGVWNVGSIAQSTLSSNDANESTNSLFGRNRFNSEMFKVLCRVAMGLGMLDNQYDSCNGKKIMLQTGLPPAYLKADAQDFKDVLAGQHSFSLKVGKSRWRRFNYTLPKENIHIMAQPMGSLLSASLDDNGNMNENANKYLSHNCLVFDAGFGTLDIYSVRNRQIDSSSSYNDYGMRQVFSVLSDKLYRKHGVDIPVHTIQKALNDGYVKIVDKKAMVSRKIDLSQALAEATEEVCNAAIQRIKQEYDYLVDYDYLLVTGGTGAAWRDIITNHFSKMEGLDVISGVTDNTLDIFANVRGYYLYQLGKLEKMQNK